MPTPPISAHPIKPLTSLLDARDGDALLTCWIAWQVGDAPREGNRHPTRVLAPYSPAQPTPLSLDLCPRYTLGTCKYIYRGFGTVSLLSEGREGSSLEGKISNAPLCTKETSPGIDNFMQYSVNKNHP